MSDVIKPDLSPPEIFAKLIDQTQTIGGTCRDGSVDETFVFGNMSFDINAARDICGGRFNCDVEVSEDWSENINIEVTNAMKSKSDRPVFIAQLPLQDGIQYLLIDGHHRMFKANQDGEETLPGFCFTPEETMLILETHPDVRSKLDGNLRHIIAKGQPTSGDVHVQAAGAEKKKKKKQLPGADDSAQGPPINPDPDAPQTEGRQVFADNNLGVDVEKADDPIERAKEVDLITMPPGIDGTSCGNCRFAKMKDGQAVYCDNKAVDQMVTNEMCCNLWDREGTTRDFEEEEVEKTDDSEVLALTTLEEVAKESNKIIPIIKADGMKQICMGVVLEPYTQDSQDDIMSEEEIEATAHQYMIDARRIGRRHKGVIEGAYPVESYIAPMDMTFNNSAYGDNVIKKGSWVLAVKVSDPAEWAKVESGEYTAFSVGGFGVRD